MLSTQQLSIFLVLSFTAIALSSKKGDWKFKQLLKKSLKEDEHSGNILKVISWNLNGQEKEAEKLCDLVKNYEPTILGLQQIRLTHISSLKACFSKLKCKRREFRGKKRGRKINKKRKERCGYQIIGAGSSNDGDSTLFTPIIFNKRRGLRETGKTGTFWLSKTPEEAFTKLEKSTEMRIATYVQLKAAVFVKRQKPKESTSKGFGKFLNALKKAGRKTRPTTKWVELCIINAQLDDKDIDVAKEQLIILLKLWKDKFGDSSMLFNVGINPKHAEDLSKVMEDEDDLVNMRKNTRVSSKIGSSFEETTMVWSKDLENIFFSDLNKSEDQKQGPSLSIVLYK